MPTPPPGLEIYETRRSEPVRVLYGARQQPLGRPVLLVGLAPGVLPSSPLAALLKREAELLSALDHPNIVLLYDYKCDQDQLWLVLEDADGWTLKELVDKGLSWQAVCAIGLDLCRALSHVHSGGHVHGKLYSEVVTLTKNGRTKLSGFGRLPRLEDDQVEALEPTELGGLSPEGSIGQPVGPPADLFALGELLYELATGKSPFLDPNDTQYPTRVRTMRQEPLLKLRNDFPPTLAELIEQCLQKAKADRPTSAEVLAQQLATLISSSTLPLLAGELERLGLIAALEAAPVAPSAPVSTGLGGRLPRSFWPITTLIAVISLLFVVVLWQKERPSPYSARASTDAPLAADEALLLRVVATPWAHVFVDGQKRETTPFARPLALSPGKHVVRLEHPNAAPEERIVEGRPGQVVLLSVQLHVERPPEGVRELSAPPDESTP